jgi:hypothetical protein
MRQTRALSSCFPAKTLKNQLSASSFQLCRGKTNDAGLSMKKARG